MKLTWDASLAARVCWGCVIASTKATAQLYVYIILQRRSETSLTGSIVFKLEKEVLKIVGKLLQKEEVAGM